MQISEMLTFRIRVAGKVAEMKALHPLPYRVCHDFMTPDQPDFRIFTERADLDYEAELYRANGTNEDLGFNALNVSVLHRKLSEALLEYNTFAMHGACIALDEEAYLFTGRSGTGKTTHIIKWLEHCPDAIVVNGDKPFIRTFNDGHQPLACGSPWAGKENLYTNTMVPLKAIILMDRSEENQIQKISYADAFPTLLQQTYRPADSEKMRKTLHLLRRLDQQVNFYRFQFNNFKDDAFQTAYDALHG